MKNIKTLGIIIVIISMIKQSKLLYITYQNAGVPKSGP